MKNKKQKSKAVEKTAKVNLITKAVLILLALAFLAIGIFAEPIFGADSEIAQVMKENVGDVANVFSSIASRGPSILRSVTIVVVVLLINYILKALIRLLLVKRTKTKTLGTLLCHFVQYLAVLIAIFTVLSAFGVDTATLLASAGILALVIGLGAQSLVADILAGLTIVVENKYQIDDTVVIDGFRGSIIDIGVTTTKLIDTSAI